VLEQIENIKAKEEGKEKEHRSKRRS
jgi:hypothetical protein